MRRLVPVLCLTLGVVGCASQPTPKPSPSAPVEGQQAPVATPPEGDPAVATRDLTAALLAGHGRAQVYLAERSPAFRKENANLDITLANSKALSSTARRAAVARVSAQEEAWNKTEEATSTQVNALMRGALPEVARCGNEAKGAGGTLSPDCQALKRAMTVWANDRQQVHTAMVEDYLLWVLVRGKADAADPAQVPQFTLADTSEPEATQCKFPDFRHPPEGAAL